MNALLIWIIVSKVYFNGPFRLRVNEEIEAIFFGPIKNVYKLITDLNKTKIGLRKFIPF